MAVDIEKQLISISNTMSKMQGLYRKIAIKNGISNVNVQILYILYFNKSVTQKQIHNLCEIPKQTINNIIKELKDKNYITLIADDIDKRQKYIVFTDEGKKYCESILEPFFNINEKVIKRVGKNLTKELAEKMSILCKALELEIEILEITKKWEENE